MKSYIYRILLMAADELVAMQEHLIAHPERDPEDALFDDIQAALTAIIPVLQRLSPQPVLPKKVRTFLESLEKH